LVAVGALVEAAGRGRDRGAGEFRNSFSRRCGVFRDVDDLNDLYHYYNMWL
jgi:hypothetical protein